MSRPKVTIVLAGEADVPALRRVVNQAYRELAEMGLNYTGTYQDDALTRARMEGKDVYLAYVNGVLAGTVSLEEVRPADDEPHFYLSQLAVIPAHKGRGLGRLLLALAEDKALERGLLRIRLDTAIPAGRLVRFYQAAGFEVIREVHWPGKTYRSYVMEKQIGR